MGAVMDFRQLVWAPRAIAEDWGETPDPAPLLADEGGGDEASRSRDG